MRILIMAHVSASGLVLSGQTVSLQRPRTKANNIPISKNTNVSFSPFFKTYDIYNYFVGLIAVRFVNCKGESINGTLSFSAPVGRLRFFIPSNMGGVLSRADEGERGDPKLSAPLADAARVGVATTRGCSATDKSMRR